MGSLPVTGVALTKWFQSPTFECFKLAKHRLPFNTHVLIEEGQIFQKKTQMGVKVWGKIKNVGYGWSLEAFKMFVRLILT